MAKNLQFFYSSGKSEELFSKKVSNSDDVIAYYLNDTSLSKLTKEQREQCQGEITKNEVKDAMGSMICTTSGITNKFHEAFGLNSNPLCYYSIKKVFCLEN